MKLLLSLLLFLPLAASGADFTGANNAVSSAVPTNQMVAVAAKAKAYDITVYNTSTSAIWLHVFDSATNQLNNASPPLVVALPANQTRSFFWTTGRPFRRGICIAGSTTDVTLTNTSTVLKIDVTYLDREF